MGVGVILGNECGIQGQKYVALPQRYSSGVKQQQGLTTLVRFYVYNVIDSPTGTITMV